MLGTAAQRVVCWILALAVISVSQIMACHHHLDSSRGANPVLTAGDQPECGLCLASFFAGVEPLRPQPPDAPGCAPAPIVRRDCARPALQPVRPGRPRAPPSLVLSAFR